MTTDAQDRLSGAGVPSAGLREVAARQAHPLLFATVSGAHLYGFPSRDSDVDLRGVHLLPAGQLLGLREPEETCSRMWQQDGVELDLVTHDLRKFVRLMLRRNGYVLEQLLSPLVVHTGDVHAELVALSPLVLTRHHAHHYRGFAKTQWRLFERTGELKPLLYTFRALLTGIHLMRGGGIEAHLPTLAAEVPEAPALVPALVAAKSEREHVPADVDRDTVRAEAERLHLVLDEAQERAKLPDTPGGHDALHDLVVRARPAAVPSAARGGGRVPRPAGAGDAPHPDDTDLVRRHTVYSCVMGSRAFGLATDTSDTDRRGVYVAPTPLFWRFEKPPTHVDGPAEEQFSWEIERFCALALRANPNILECLHSPLVEHLDDTGRELLDLRPAFLSRQVHATFVRYAQAQYKKLQADVRQHGAPRWKHAMHLLRLLMSCGDLLRTGHLVIDVGEHRAELLAVKRGEVPWPEAEARMARLAEAADRALDRSPLPAEPDAHRVEDFLLRVRRQGSQWPDRGHAPAAR